MPQVAKELTPAEQQFLKEFEESIREVELALEGKIQLKDAREMLSASKDIFPKKKKRRKEQQRFLDGLKQALHGVELHEQGKITLPTFQEMMAQL